MRVVFGAKALIGWEMGMGMGALILSSDVSSQPGAG